MMWKSIFYKEWLKIRWFLLGYTLLAVSGIGYQFLTLKHGFAFTGGKNMWNDVLFLGSQFFKSLRFIPLAGGILIGFSQYLPETVDQRIKLTFHLPYNENRALMLMNAFGGLSLLFSFLIIYGLFAGVCLTYFPIQILVAVTASVIPWFMAGIAVYFVIALAVLEPSWKFRFCYLLIGSFLLTVYLKAPLTAAFAPVNSGLLIITLPLSVALLFSGYRLRKGEM